MWWGGCRGNRYPRKKLIYWKTFVLTLPGVTLQGKDYSSRNSLQYEMLNGHSQMHKQPSVTSPHWQARYSITKAFTASKALTMTSFQVSFDQEDKEGKWQLGNRKRDEVKILWVTVICRGSLLANLHIPLVYFIFSMTKVNGIISNLYAKKSNLPEI